MVISVQRIMVVCTGAHHMKTNGLLQPLTEIHTSYNIHKISPFPYFVSGHTCWKILLPLIFQHVCVVSIFIVAKWKHCHVWQQQFKRVFRIVSNIIVLDFIAFKDPKLYLSRNSTLLLIWKKSPFKYIWSKLPTRPSTTNPVSLSFFEFRSGTPCAQAEAYLNAYR